MLAAQLLVAPGCEPPSVGSFRHGEAAGRCLPAAVVGAVAGQQRLGTPPVLSPLSAIAVT